MKTIVNAGELKRALAAIKKVIERRNTIPILSCVSVRVSPGIVELTGTDLDILLSVKIPADSIGFAEFPAPPFVALYDAVKGADAKAAVILSSDDAAKFNVTCGAMSIALNALPFEDFPEMRADNAAPGFSLTGSQCAELFGRPAFAMSQEETRYYLNGVFLHNVAGELRAVASDGHRLCIECMPAPAGADFAGVIIPRKVVKMLPGLFKKAAGVVIHPDAAGDGCKIMFLTKTVRLVSTIVDGTFPDYERVMPRQPVARIVTVDGATLSANVKSVSAVSADRTQSVKFIVNGRLSGVVNNPASGNASFDQALVDHSGVADEMAIGFYANYIVDALAAFDNADAVAFGINDACSPILITAPHTSRRVVLMPLRL